MNTDKAEKYLLDQLKDFDQSEYLKKEINAMAQFMEGYHRHELKNNVGLPDVRLSLPDDDDIEKKAHEWLKSNYGKYKPSEWRAFIEASTWMRELSKGNEA